MDVTLALPSQTSTSAVEIEVSVEGRRTKDVYRVITVACETSAESSSVGDLRRAVLSVEAGWELVSIGAPGENGIPLLFRHRTFEEKPV